MTDDWQTRCDWCNWPLKSDPKDGCTAHNCSMRPLPELDSEGERRQELRKAYAGLRRVGELVVELTGAQVHACGGEADAFRPADVPGLVEDVLKLADVPGAAKRIEELEKQIADLLAYIGDAKKEAALRGRVTGEPLADWIRRTYDED